MHTPSTYSPLGMAIASDLLPDSLTELPSEVSARASGLGAQGLTFRDSLRIAAAEYITRRLEELTATIRAENAKELVQAEFKIRELQRHLDGFRKPTLANAEDLEPKED